MKVSLIISSFNRLKYFVNTWQTIKDQLLEGDELVVVEDGIEKGWNGYLLSLGVKYQLVETHHDTYRSGVIPKNIALKMARNDLIIINDPEVMHISPCITVMRKFLEERRAFVVPGTLYSGKYEGQGLEGSTKMENSQAPFVGGCHKQDLMDIGGWDERFKYWGNDDNDLMTRLGMNHVRHIVVPELEIFHQWHERPPKQAMGDYNEPFLYEKDKPVIANIGKQWGLLTGSYYEN